MMLLRLVIKCENIFKLQLIYLLQPYINNKIFTMIFALFFFCSQIERYTYLHFDRSLYYQAPHRCRWLLEAADSRRKSSSVLENNNILRILSYNFSGYVENGARLGTNIGKYLLSNCSYVLICIFLF